MPGVVNRPGSGQSPHMYKAAVGNVKITLQVVKVIKSGSILIVLNYAAARDKFALRGLNLWVSKKPWKLSNFSDFSRKISNISQNNLRVCWMLQDSKYALRMAPSFGCAI